MNEKIGRNDLCACGSGKKYKKCCLQNVVFLNTPDEEWRKLRQLEGAVIDKHLTPYSTQELPPELVKLALKDCFPGGLPEEIDQDLLFRNFFIPWFLFNWIPAEEFDVKHFDPEKTVSHNYLEVHGSRLNSEEKRFIEAMNKTYYSFYSILEVELEKRLVVKDILLGTTHTIKERQGTHMLKRGDIVFSRILTLDNQSIFIGMAPYIIPTRYHHDVIDFKDWLIKEHDTQALTPELLRDSSDMELCDYFFDLMEAAYNQPFPTLVNTDGELMQFMKSYFKLTIQPEEALHRLLPLTLLKDVQAFLDDAKRSKSGAIQKINIPWLKKGNKTHKSWNNTIMGQITLQENRLILETNSAERHQRGKKLLNKYLGEAISFQKTLIESPEKKIEYSPALIGKNKEDINLMELPEIQEQLKAMVKAHWENWFDESIPALNNQTPRKAAKTKEGRERLEALLLQFERHNAEKKDNNLLGPDINYLRKELALDSSISESSS